MKNRRTIATVVILLSIIFLPYWIYAPLVVGAALALPLYWEGIVFGFLIDSLYGKVGLSLYDVLLSFSFWILVLLLVVMPLRRIVRTYA